MKNKNGIIKGSFALVLFCILLIVLAFSSTKAYAANSQGMCGDDVYWKLENGTLTLSGNGPMYEYSRYSPGQVPWKGSVDYIDTVIVEDGVTSLSGNFMSLGSKSLTTVILGNDVESIGEYAFYSCEKLQSIDIPSSVKSIGDWAFWADYSLNELTLHEGLESIGSRAFESCGISGELVIPSTVTEFGSSAFDGLRINSLILSEGLKNLGERTFCKCEDLTEIHIPSTMEGLGKDPFMLCSNITDVYVNGTYAYWMKLLESSGSSGYMTKATIHTNISDLSGATVTLDEDIYSYTGKEITPWPDVYFEDVKLSSKTDYDISYSNNINPGTATVTVTGKDHFEGSQSVNFKIAVPLKDCSVYLDSSSFEYTGEPIKDPVTVKYNDNILEEGKDYTVEYSDNIEIGEAKAIITGCGSYYGTITKTFEITEMGDPMAFSRSRFILCVDTSFSTYVERNRGGALKYESSDPSVATVSEDGVVTGIKPGTVTITASNEKETCNCTVEVEDYAYMGGADDRSLHRDIPEATTQYVRVYAYTDTHGQDMVLTYINYKIITNWDQYTLHNLTAGTKIKDPTEYYQKLADRAFGGNKLMYLDIISEITWAKTQILKGNCRYYDPNEAAEGDSTSTDEQTQDGSETKTSDEQTAKPSKEETDSEETAVDKTKQVGSDGTAMGKGASAEAATKALTSAKGNKDLKGSVFNKLRVEQSKVTKTSITIKWKKIKGAKKYIVFAGKSGKNYKVQKVATLKNTKTKYTLKKFNNKTLTKGTYYKFAVVALNSKGKVITSSKFAHVATLGKNKKSNPATVTVSDKVKKNKITIKVKKTFKLKGAYAASAKKFKIRKVLPMRYESTNPKVAKVSSKGVITAKKKGTCYIFAYAQNGMYQRIKVTVK